MLLNVNNLTGCRLLEEVTFYFDENISFTSVLVDGKTFDVFLIKVSTVKLKDCISFNLIHL